MEWRRRIFLGVLMACLAAVFGQTLWYLVTEDYGVLLTESRRKLEV